VSTNQHLVTLARALTAATRRLQNHEVIVEAHLQRIVQLEQRVAQLEPASRKASGPVFHSPPSRIERTS